MVTYYEVIIFSWVAFLMVWGLSALNVKRDIRGGYSSFWRQFWLIRIVAAAFLVFVAVRIATGTAHYAIPARSVFSRALFLPPLPLGWIAAILSVTGVGVAIWARFHLGRNWSPRPAVKEGHGLVTTGPYAYIRHPIYAGMILAALGAALTGTAFGLIVFIIASLVFAARIDKEEKILLGLFPEAYPAYQKRTKRLIPFVW